MVAQHGSRTARARRAASQDDVATLYHDDDADRQRDLRRPCRRSATTACIGHSAFYVTARARRDDRSTPAPTAVTGSLDAGSIWTAGDSAVGDARASAAGRRRRLRRDSPASSSTASRSAATAAVRVPECPSADAAERPAVVAPPPIRRRRAAADGRAVAAGASRASIGATGSSLRPLRLPARWRKRASVALPFAFPEPGTVDAANSWPRARRSAPAPRARRQRQVRRLDQADPGRAQAAQARQEDAEGDRSRARSRPSRAGGSAQRAAVTVTLKR